MTNTQWEVLKWVGNVCLLLGTIAMISPHAAATSITPWLLYFIGNVTWIADSVHTSNKPWIYIGTFLASWDILTIVTRLTGIHVFQIFDPLVVFLNILP